MAARSNRPELCSADYRILWRGVDWDKIGEPGIRCYFDPSFIGNESPAKVKRQSARMIERAGMRYYSIWPERPGCCNCVIEKERSGSFSNQVFRHTEERDLYIR